jgi:outer membrane protein assembly factor BamD
VTPVLVSPYRIICLSLVTACATTTTGAQAPAPGSPEAIYAQAMEDLDDGLYPEALRGFNDVKAKFPYSKFAALSDLRVADTHLERGKQLEAIDAYRNFLKFHPNHEESSYAMLKIGDSYYDQIPTDWWFLPPSAEKDQGNTKLAIAAYRDMIARYPNDKLAAESKQKLDECRRKLADHEMYVARFYFERDRYKAAAARAEGLLDTYAGLGLDEEALWIAGMSRFQTGEKDMARRALKKLVAEFPQGANRATAEEMLAQLGTPPAPGG